MTDHLGVLRAATTRIAKVFYKSYKSGKENEQMALTDNHTCSHTTALVASRCVIVVIMRKKLVHRQVMAMT